jgi:hypothetical protein
MFGKKPFRPGEDGSIALTMLVAMVASMLLLAVLTMVQGGLRSSRRAGDSANALQVADAGVNDAVKALTAHTTGFSGSNNLGAAGSYTYTVTKDEDSGVWHINSLGVDATGVKRRILADAVDAPLFANAFFALATAQLKGTADSYTGPSDTCSTNPAAGRIGSNGTITFTGGVGTKNCRGQYGWAYAADGCVFYGQTTIPNDANGNNPIGPGACPPAPDTLATTAKFTPPPVTIPAGLTNEGAYTCPANGTITPGTHLYTTVTFNNGCGVAAGATAIIYATAAVAIGTVSGNCKSVINQPVGSGSCGGSFPSSWYTAGRPAQLQINVAGNATVSFTNHAVFWGVIDAPQSLVTASGGGTPQVDVFGSVVATSADSAAQFAFHYEQSLGELVRTGQYQTRNWREEPV